MANKIAVVTGANKGIGRAIVERLLDEAPEFTKVVMTARDSLKGTQTRDEILKTGQEARLVFHQLDITDSSSIQSFADFLSSEFSQIDVLVNNAGIATRGDAFSYDIAYTTLSTNFYSTVKVTDCLVPYIKETGHIINISSRLGHASHITNEFLRTKVLNVLTREELFALAEDFLEGVKLGNHSERGWHNNTYSVSKILLNCYTRILSKEVGMMVNAVSPGWVRTDMTGSHAALSPFEGAETPLFLARLQNYQTGCFWKECKIQDWE